MSYVFVLDAQRRPLQPCTPARARILLHTGKAAVLRSVPFTLILREAHSEAVVTPLRLKIDPGSKTTGLAVVNDHTGNVIWAAELTHRSAQIREALRKRGAARRSRRQRTTRYRPARYANRRRPQGWLAPSLLSRVLQVMTWVQRLRRWCPIGAISQELVRFDPQALHDPEIHGVAYQRGTLFGMEVREYVLAKWQHRCAYCQRDQVPFELDHILPKSRGGSDRVSNLALSCHDCNQSKADRTANEFGHPEVEAQAKVPLRDAAAVNSTRWRLYQELCATGVPVETGTGGSTRWNRQQQGLPKTHWLDAACCGASTPPRLWIRRVSPLLIKAKGWQRRQMCLMSAAGFPRTRAKQQSCVQDFRTGDLVQAVVPAGKKAGRYVGRVAVRASGSFNITTPHGTIQGIHARYCRMLHRSDGYEYVKGGAAFPPVP
jgi:5-methylcytosine-specific restriction endonuclease McrA